VAAAVVVRRPFGAVVGVIGAGGSVAAPAILVFLSLDSVYPLVTTVAATVGAAGAFALVLTTVELASRSAPPEPA
jgi:hypothetical protein